MLIDVFVLSVIICLVMGGSLYGIGRIPVRMPLLFVIACGLQFVMVNFSGDWDWIVRNSSILYMLSYVFLFFGLYANRHIKAGCLLVVGIMLNFVVIILNGGRMPISIPAAHAAGLSEFVDYISSGIYPTHTLISETTKLWFLGDIIPLPPSYIRPRVFSIGDAVMGVGVFMLVKAYMLDCTREK
jgi:hypothetical protein